MKKEGGAVLQLHIFLTLALYAGKCSASQPLNRRPGQFVYICKEKYIFA
jgi:hypothetical protein